MFFYWLILPAFMRIFTFFVLSLVEKIMRLKWAW